MRVWLNVEYREKDEAKNLGARWNPGKRQWYVDNPENLKPFIRWINKEQLKPYEKAVAHENQWGKWNKSKQVNHDQDMTVKHWIEQLKAVGYPCSRPSPFHLTYRRRGYHIDAWPTTGKFITSGRGKGQGLESLLAELEARIDETLARV